MHFLFLSSVGSGISESAFSNTIILKTIEMQYGIFLNIAETGLYDIRGLIYVLAVVIADI
jgi:hypothetical protein